MNTGKYIFAQLIEFLPQRIFDRIVMKYEGNKYVKHFTCWNQLLVMMFGQLSNRDSLRDLTSIISAHSNKAYHLGFQIYSAITAYCMVAIVEHDLKLHRSTYEVLRILSASLLDKTPIKELFTKEPEYVADDGQLTLNFI